MTRLLVVHRGAPLDLLPEAEREKVYKWSSAAEQLARRGLAEEEEGQQPHESELLRMHMLHRGGPSGCADDAAPTDPRLRKLTSALPWLLVSGL